MVFSVLVALFLISSIGETTKSHTEPCQGSKVVAERHECHDLSKLPGWNVLCALVRCRDAAPRFPPLVSVASCEKQKVSDVSKLVVKLLVYSLALWNVLIMNNALHIKEDNGSR
jgi:hypothetical protein